jgi:hypothetical protein
MSKCVNCGKEQLRVVCPECMQHIVNEADRELLPVIGASKPISSRRIGFEAPASSGVRGEGKRR